MPGTCHHGLPADDCLICRVGQSPAGQSPAGRSPMRAPDPPGRSPAGTRSPSAVGPRQPSLVVHGAGLIAGIVVIGLIAWIVAGAVFALLHLLELVVVAGAAAWVGYRVGKVRGRRGG